MSQVNFSGIITIYGCLLGCFEKKLTKTKTRRERFKVSSGRWLGRDSEFSPYKAEVVDEVFGRGQSYAAKKPFRRSARPPECDRGSMARVPGGVPGNELLSGSPGNATSGHS